MTYSRDNIDGLQFKHRNDDGTIAITNNTVFVKWVTDSGDNKSTTYAIENVLRFINQDFCWIPINSQLQTPSYDIF